METCPAAACIQIGAYDPALPGERNKMRPLLHSFEAQAVPMLRALMESVSQRVFFDEIGYLESSSQSYLNVLRELFEAKQVIAAIRKQDTPFLLELRSRPDVFCVDLDAPFGNMGCVIMASGLSRRFGTNKLMEDFHGVPMIGRVLAATDGIFARRVVVTRHDEVVSFCQSCGVEVIRHDLPLRSDTVRLGLEAVGEVEGCLFCPADQPLLRQSTVASLMLCAVHAPDKIWRPCFGSNPGSPVFFPVWAFPMLMNLPEGKGGGFIARKYPEHVRTLPLENGYELADADTRETLSQLLKLWEEPS